MHLIVYSKGCLSCKHRKLFKKLKKFSRLNQHTIEERRIHLNQEWHDQAVSHGVELPFVFNGKIAQNLNEDLDKL